MRTVIFDLDGTLADTSGDLIAAANHCFQTLGEGQHLSFEDDQATAFRGGKAMLRLGFGRSGLKGDALEAAVEGGYPALLEFYGQNIDTHTVLYPGVVPALEQLARTGHRLGVCTNKPAGLAETLLARLNIRYHFGAMIGADTLPVRKPDPAPLFEAISQLGGTPARSVLVGDTITDALTGRAAGVPVILTTFGPTGHGVKDHGPDGLFDHYDTLHQVVDSLLDKAG